MEQNLENKVISLQNLLWLTAHGVEGFRCRSPPWFTKPQGLKMLCCQGDIDVSVSLLEGLSACSQPP